MSVGGGDRTWDPEKEVVRFINNGSPKKNIHEV